MGTKRTASSSGTAAIARSATPWRIHFFQRHHDDDEACTVPGRDFLRGCPVNVEAKLIAILKSVAEAPPPAFSGGGKWEAMHDEMRGYYEARADGRNREHFRLFCMLDRDGATVGLGGPSVIVITGARKGFRTVFSASDYTAVRQLGSEFLGRKPRSVLR